MAEPDPVDESLAIARRALAASAASKARVRARVDASSAVAHEGSGHDGSRTAAPRATRVLDWLKTSVAAGALLGFGFIAGYWLARHPELDPLAQGVTDTAPVESARPPELEATAPVTNAAQGAAPTASAEAAAREQPASAPDALPRDVAPSTLPRQRRPPARRLASAASSEAGPRTPEPRRDPFLDELALLSRVERAIRANQPDLALTLLDELEQRHPRSPLLEERAAARLLVSCLLHEPTARARAVRFVSERAASVYVERVRHACNLPKGPARADTDLREGGPHVQTP